MTTQAFIWRVRSSLIITEVCLERPSGQVGIRRAGAGIGRACAVASGAKAGGVGYARTVTEISLGSEARVLREYACDKGSK
eukprot:1597226-Pleurochrysis_carterae.AAC.3